jgi:hypothetical protein
LIELYGVRVGGVVGWKWRASLFGLVCWCWGGADFLILLLLETEPGKAEISSTVADEEGFQIVSQDNIGLMFPRFDNLNARHRTQQVGGFTSRSELGRKDLTVAF